MLATEIFQIPMKVFIIGQDSKSGWGKLCQPWSSRGMEIVVAWKRGEEIKKTFFINSKVLNISSISSELLNIDQNNFWCIHVCCIGPTWQQLELDWDLVRIDGLLRWWADGGKHNQLQKQLEQENIKAANLLSKVSNAKKITFIPTNFFI